MVPSTTELLRKQGLANRVQRPIFAANIRAKISKRPMNASDVGSNNSVHAYVAPPLAQSLGLTGPANRNEGEPEVPKLLFILPVCHA